MELTKRSERWQWLDTFVATWWTTRRGSSSFSQDRLNAAEARLKRPLPVALQEWYSRFARYSYYWSSQDQFLMPEQLFIDNGLLVFYVECQGVVQWGVPEDTDEDDPPVLLDMSDLADEPEQDAVAISEFALAMALYASKFGLSNSASGGANSPLMKQFLQASAHQRCAFLPWHWPTFPTTFYLSSDSIIEVQGEVEDDCWVSVAALTRDRLTQCMELLTAVGIELRLADSAND